ncbi:RNA polymerase sigma factor [Streptomyces sp. AN091965]|uniref:RNA polymerase sigma factor n=1 Tax=Streptomyces sp. AN091965 TaxID=2927803 RepID=UPI001F620F0F|nr:sigma-70 family RNA polymerase sigma factor [Streptomyces sp. AN091965]MCI3928861.1 sigma-70 family RNA polymerase sigma factor [Streptomyces sp. AN091965]
MAEPEAVTAETLGRVFAQYQGEMTSKARRLLADAGVPESAADADDIVSSALVTALKDPGAVRRPRAYLYKLIRTEVVHIAARLGEHRRLDERRAADPLCCPAPAVADFSALVDNRDAVHRAMQALTTPQRTAVWATHALDYTRDETAVLIGKHPGTVARHCSRAILLLRTALVAAVAGVSFLWLAVGGGLRLAMPADSWNRDPILSPEGWRTVAWLIPASTTALVCCSVWVLWRLEPQLVEAARAWLTLSRRGRVLRRFLPDPAAREAASPMRAMLCSSCHRRMGEDGLTKAEWNSLMHRVVDFAPRGRGRLMSCQLCGRLDSMDGPVATVSLPRMKLLNVYKMRCDTCQSMSSHRELAIGEYDALRDPPKGPWFACMTVGCDTVRPRRRRRLGRHWRTTLVTSGAQKTAEPTSATSEGAQPLGTRKSRNLAPAIEVTSALPLHRQIDATPAALESRAARADSPS